jgi:hypothetical protein
MTKVYIITEHDIELIKRYCHNLNRLSQEEVFNVLETLEQVKHFIIMSHTDGESEHKLDPVICAEDYDTATDTVIKWLDHVEAKGLDKEYLLYGRI